MFYVFNEKNLLYFVLKASYHTYVGTALNLDFWIVSYTIQKVVSYPIWKICLSYLNINYFISGQLLSHEKPCIE